MMIPQPTDELKPSILRVIRGIRGCFFWPRIPRINTNSIRYRSSELDDGERVVTGAFRAATLRFGHLPVRPQNDLRLRAPKTPVIRGRHFWNALRLEEHRLPSQKPADF